MTDETSQATPASAAPDSGETAPAAEAAAPAPDFSFVPDQFKGEDGAADLNAFRASYDDAQAKLAEIAARQEGAPETPDGYSFTLPDDFKFDGIDGLPDDFSVEIDAANPAFEPIRAALHEHRLPQSMAQTLVTSLAKHQAAEYAKASAAMAEDLKTLGANSDTRVSEVRRKLESALPAEQAAGIMSATMSAAGVKALEALLSGRSHTAPTPQPSTPDLGGKSGVELLRLGNAKAS